MKVAFTFNKKNLFSRAIAWFTNSKWSHCFIVISDMYDDSIIAEASMHGGIKLNLLSRYLDKSIYNLEILNLNNIETKESNNILLSKIGSNYGYTQILGYLIARIFTLKHNPLTKDEVCSEFVLLVLKNSKVGNMFQDLDLNDVTPEILYRRLINGANIN